jgi:hypothetical protein
MRHPVVSILILAAYARAWFEISHSGDAFLQELPFQVSGEKEFWPFWLRRI